MSHPLPPRKNEHLTEWFKYWLKQEGELRPVEQRDKIYPTHEEYMADMAGYPALVVDTVSAPLRDGR